MEKKKKAKKNKTKKGSVTYISFNKFIESILSEKRIVKTK